MSFLEEMTFPPTILKFKGNLWHSSNGFLGYFQEYNLIFLDYLFKTTFHLLCRNKVLMKSLQWDYNARKKGTALIYINGRKMTAINFVVPLTSELQAVPHLQRFLLSGLTASRLQVLTLRAPEPQQCLLLVCWNTETHILKWEPELSIVKGLSEEIIVCSQSVFLPQNSDTITGCCLLVLSSMTSNGWLC